MIQENKHLVAIAAAIDILTLAGVVLLLAKVW
jgi:hypothetical protein